MITGIYRIDGPNDCVYIGSAVNIKHRWQLHRTQLDANTHGNRHLQRAWNKYKETDFTFSLLEQCAKEQLLHYEQIWLDILFQSLDKDQVYNICTKAGNTAGRKFTEESRAKMSASQGKRTHSLYTREKMSKARMGKVQSLETRQKRVDTRKRTMQLRKEQR